MAFGPTSHELTEQFVAWDERLRGWDVWPFPVALEPPLTFPTYFYGEPENVCVDDVRSHTFLSGFADGLKSLFGPESTTLPATIVTDSSEDLDPLDAVPELFVPDMRFAEVPIWVPSESESQHTSMARFFQSVSSYGTPLGFEVIGSGEEIRIQFVTRHGNQEQLLSYMHAFVSDVAVVPHAVPAGAQSYLEQLWHAAEHAGNQTLLVDAGLSREVTAPLASITHFGVDPLIPIVTALEQVEESECAVFQILTSPADPQWAGLLRDSVTNPDGSSFFENDRYLMQQAREKTATPLFATTIRIGVCAQNEHRSRSIAQSMFRALAQVDHPQGNELIPLSNDDYPDDVHLSDILQRRTHRSGMLLSLNELLSFVHVPDASVRSSKLSRPNLTDVPAPECVRSRTTQSILLGENNCDDRSIPVYLSPAQRLRHMHLVGASGTGKSTLLLSCIQQDMELGHGCAVLDPHGDLIDHALSLVPDERVGDVILFDPADHDFPIGFNLLSATTEAEKVLLTSDLVGIFQRFSTSWGDQLGTVLANAIMAFVDHQTGEEGAGTLLSLRRFLVDANFRATILSDVADPQTRFYWEHEFPLLPAKSVGPVITRLDTFLRAPTIRRILGQRRNALNLHKAVAEGKIVLIKLSHGTIGEENAHLLGALITAKLYQAALARQSMARENRTPFFVYIDEFHHFITPSMAPMLSGVRKYGLGMVLSHQELQQLHQDRDVMHAVLNNSYTRVTFRVSHLDAQILEKHHAHFDAHTFQDLGTGEAIARVERHTQDFSLRCTLPELPQPEDAADTRGRIVSRSQHTYGTPKDTVDEEINAFWASAVSPKALKKTKPIQPNTTAPSEKTTPHVETPAVGQPQTTKPATESAKRLSQHQSEPASHPTKISDPKPSKDTTTTERGRGGPQHKYLQTLITKLGQDHGYKATAEYQIPGTGGRIDVALEHGGKLLACEISISTPTAHEVANVQKCVDAGAERIVVLVHKARRKSALIKRMKETLSSADLEKTQVLTPEEFITYIEEHAPPKTSETKTVRGYAVKVNYSTVSEEERKERRHAIAGVIAASMKRMEK